MTSSPAAIDVLVTVYNGERFLSQTLDSVLAQTFADWRLIVVDDQSTDRTADILREYAARDPRILVVPGAHRGIAAAANIGLRHVTAPLVARLDGDDVCLPERLQVQFDYLNAHPEISALGSDVFLIDENNRRLRRRRAPTGWETIREILQTRNCMCHPSAMIRTSVLQQIGGYREKFRNSLDYDLWLRISEIGRIDNLSQDLLLYRRHDSQVSAAGNAHRQTVYSVGAATDHFLRRYLGKSPETVFDLNDPADIVDKLCDLYGQALDEPDRRALNRHGLRLLRYAENLPAGSRDRLYRAMQSGLTLRERLKGLLYRFF